MNSDIVLWLVQDGITNGAIYALLALALLLVFTVTRVIFVPQGEYISYAALSFALLQAGKVPGTGLGISIAKEILHLHGGTMQIESKSGVGTTVVLCIPCAPAAASGASGS